MPAQANPGGAGILQYRAADDATGQDQAVANSVSDDRYRGKASAFEPSYRTEAVPAQGPLQHLSTHYILLASVGYLVAFAFQQVVSGAPARSPAKHGSGKAPLRNTAAGYVPPF
ncbi:MAG: hypothetical protein WDW36_010095 [Sanguina aurantia]